jgi:hypothetical protein
LAHGVTADIESVQMSIDLQLSIQIQLLVDEPKQIVKAAFAHAASSGLIAPAQAPRYDCFLQTSGSIEAILLAGIHACLSHIAHLSDHSGKYISRFHQYVCNSLAFLKTKEFEIFHGIIRVIGEQF